MRDNLLARRFVRHHIANPRVWAAYEAAILKIINSGRKHGGVKAVTESIRWQTRLEGDSEGALDWEDPQLSLELEYATTT